MDHALFLFYETVFCTKSYGEEPSAYEFQAYGYALNVNEWLVESGYASIWDHYNEFDPYSWSLWVPI